MFDTLRFATRLKRSGFEDGQAEGMAHALVEEMGKLLEHLATKAGLEAVKRDLEGVKRDLEGVKRDLEAQIAALSARVDALQAKVDALQAKVDTLQAKVDTLEVKVDALAMQQRFMFAMLAVLLALGLIDTVPGLLG